MGNTVGWVFEEREGKLLLSHSDVEDDDAGVGVVDGDVLDGEPDEELFLGEADDADEAAVAEISPQDAVEVDPVLDVLGEARPVEVDLEDGGGGERVGLDLLGDEAGRKAPRPKEVVDGGGERRGSEEREDGANYKKKKSKGRVSVVMTLKKSHLCPWMAVWGEKIKCVCFWGRLIREESGCRVKRACFYCQKKKKKKDVRETLLKRHFF